MNTTITVMTPTFNRAKELPRLYKSLQELNNKNFIWMVVDDGSTDGTKDLFDKWKEEADFPIEYHQKPNGGKHTALNYAVNRIETELIFIVDSDDWLTPDAIDVIEAYHNKYKDNDKLCGYSFWRVFPDGKCNGPEFPKDEMIANFFTARILGNIDGDKAEVWKTKCMKEYPFPEFPGEKCYPEDGIWIRMSGPYGMVNINKGIYIGDYLEDGLTSGGKKVRLTQWPKGMVDRSRQYLKKKCPFKVICKHTILYTIYGTIGAKYPIGELFSNCPKRGMFILLFVPSMVISLIWKNKYLKG